MNTRFRDVNYPFWLGLILAFMGTITTTAIALSTKGFGSYYWLNIAGHLPRAISLWIKVAAAKSLLAELSDLHLMLITLILTVIITIGYFSLAAYFYNRSKKKSWRIGVSVISIVVFIALQFLGSFLSLLTDMGGPITDIDFEKAVLSGDPQNCIDIGYKVNTCVSRMAEENDNPEICLAIPTSDAKDNCITRFAVKHGLKSSCDMILELEHKEPYHGHMSNYYGCLLSLAESTVNDTLCEEIPEEDPRKTVCHERVQIELNQG